MGPVHAVFKADGDETRGRYSISEWWLEPYTRGPGAHTHEEDDVFFVIEGTMSFFVGGAWIDAPKGSLVIAPGGTAFFSTLTGFALIWHIGWLAILGLDSASDATGYGF